MGLRTMKSIETYEDVLATLDKLDIKNSRIRNPIYGTRKELREIPKVLEDHEEILFMIPGAWGGASWLIVCTDKRIIFLDKGYVFRFNMKEIPVDKINSIESKRGLIFGEIHMWDGADKTVITHCLKDDVQRFVTAVNFAKSKQRENNFKQRDTQLRIQELKELQELLNAEILTKEEFEREKQRILRG